MLGLGLLSFLCVTAVEARGQGCVHPCVGPARGALIAAGGGDLDDRVYEEFVHLAGGQDARIVLIPTAGAEYGSSDAWTAIERLKEVGVERLEILHTRSRSVADLPVFASPLATATGVWLSGGRQSRLVDVYLDTYTHQALRDVLARGGVIGGNSAGASALASFLLRGGEDASVLVAVDHRDGFGFLHDVAIDQHLADRGRENEMFEVLHQNPYLLGIGLNEGAGLVITGDLARVIGNRVAIYDVTDPLTLIPLRWLAPGDAYDLGNRRTVLTEGDRPTIVAPLATPAPGG